MAYFWLFLAIFGHFGPFLGPPGEAGRFWDPSLRFTGRNSCRKIHLLVGPRTPPGRHFWPFFGVFGRSHSILALSALVIPVWAPGPLDLQAEMGLKPGFSGVFPLFSGLPRVDFWTSETAFLPPRNGYFLALDKGIFP